MAGRRGLQKQANRASSLLTHILSNSQARRHLSLHLLEMAPGNLCFCNLALFCTCFGCSQGKCPLGRYHLAHLYFAALPLCSLMQGRSAWAAQVSNVSLHVVLLDGCPDDCGLPCSARADSCMCAYCRALQASPLMPSRLMSSGSQSSAPSTSSSTVGQRSLNEVQDDRMTEHDSAFPVAQ